MAVTNVSIVKTILEKLEPLSSTIKVVYENSGLFVGNEFKPGQTIIGFNAFIKNLRVFASVPSLPEAPFPDFKNTDSSTQKLIKTLDIEWGTPRKQLDIFITDVPNPVINDWSQIGSVSLLNPYGYPFRVYNLMDLFTDNLALELGENGKIAVRMFDVGQGLLAIQDSVVIHGSYTEEIFLQSPDLPNVFNINISGITAGGNNNSNGSTVTPTDNTIGNNYSVDNNQLVGN